MFPKFELFGTSIFSYPLMMGMAWGASINLVLYYNRKLALNFKQIKLLIVLQFILGWIGAKSLFLLSITTSQPLNSSLSFWLGGGFVFYGGLIAASLVSFIFFYLKKIPWSYANIFIPALALGHGIGRIGCFLAGCCYGTYCELPWAIKLHGIERHPVQLYEALSLFVIFYFLNRRVLARRTQNLWAWYFLAYPLLRFILEFFRGDSIRGIFAFGLSTSQWISLLIGALAATFLILQHSKKR